MTERNPWRPRFPRGAVPPAIASWLAEPESLTARCQAASRDFRVRLLDHRLAAPHLDEGDGRRRPAWVREVALECDGMPVIFAHTVMPAGPRGRLTRWLAGLGSRSLGSLLFTCPEFSRGRLEFLRLDRRHPLYRQAAQLASLPPRVWARRSLHTLGRQSVLVTEVFLPAIARLGA